MSVEVGVDLGGTKTSAVAFSTDGSVRGRATVATRRGEVPATVLDAIDTALAAGEARRGDVVRVGIASPGLVDGASGTIRAAVNLDADDLPLAAAVEAAVDAPCALEHDARAAAWWLHTAGDDEDLAYLSVGTGVSAGIVLDGTLLRGRHGIAGEIGHLVADPDGPICPCGLRGCLEAVASGPALERRAERPAEAVFRAAAHGEPSATALVEELGGHLARAVRGLALAFGVARVHLGGGVATAGAALLGPLDRALERERSHSPITRAALPSGFVRIVPPSADAVARGAVLVARERTPVRR